MIGELEVPGSFGGKALEAFGDPEGPKVCLIYQMTSSENYFFVFLQIQKE